MYNKTNSKIIYYSKISSKTYYKHFRYPIFLNLKKIYYGLFSSTKKHWDFPRFVELNHYKMSKIQKNFAHFI